ncbi:3-hydroxyisobutyryl-CoA hydrolase, mitochondrial-like isoform X2 [Babylonia areolata]
MISRSIQRIHVALKHVRMAQYSTQAADEVLFNAVNDKRIIILNRPKTLNALNLNMIRYIYPKMLEWEIDPYISMVVMKGAGDKAFCAGGDIVSITKAGKAGDLGKEFFKEEYMLNYKIGSFKKPYVAFIDGITMGGGVGLSVHGKYRVATERTVFAMPETAIGLFPDVGGGHFLPWLKGRLGTFLALTGFRLKGRDVHHAGVATHFVQAEKMNELEQALMQLPEPSHLQVEKVLDSFHNENPTDKDKPFVLAPYLEKIDTIFNQATVEDIMKQLESDQSEWAQQQLKILKKMSPTSLKVTLKQLQTGETLSLAEVLQMEYRLSQRCLEDNDFFEGVRAVLVDKDQNPKWQPDRLEGVTAEKLDHYFSPLAPDRELVL